MGPEMGREGGTEAFFFVRFWSSREFARGDTNGDFCWFRGVEVQYNYMLICDSGLLLGVIQGSIGFPNA